MRSRFLEQLESLIENGRFQEALTLAEHAVSEHTEDSPGPDHAGLLEALGILHRELGHYSQAEGPLLQALSIRAADPGKEHPKYAKTLHELARLYEETGQYSAAERLYRSAITIGEKAASQHPEALARCLHDFAGFLDLSGNYEESERCYAQAGELRLQHFGPDHPAYALSLAASAFHAWRKGKLQESESPANRAVSILRAGRGERHPEYASCLLLLGRIYLHQGKLEESQEIGSQALAIRKAVFGERHHRYASALDNQAILRSIQGQFAESERLARLAEEITREAVGDSHLFHADSLITLGFILQTNQKYSESEESFQKAREIYRAHYPRAKSHLASCVRDLGSCYVALQRFSRAEECYREAVELLDPIQAICSLEWVETRQALARVLAIQHRDEEAVNYAQETVDLVRRMPETNSILFCASLDGLARVFQHKGDLHEAELLWREIIQSRQKSLGTNHPLYVEGLRCLGGVFASQGNFDSAIDLEQQAVNVLRRLRGPTHPDTLHAISSLAETYWHQGDFQQAESLFTFVIENEKTRVGETHPDFIHAVQALARVYLSMGNFQAAEVRYRQVLTLLERLHGQEHPAVATAFHDLAGLYQQAGDLVTAETLYQQACDIRQKDPGETHPDYAMSLYGLAMVYQGLGRFSQADSLFHNAEDILSDSLGETHPQTLRVKHSLALFDQARGNVSEAIEQLQLVRDSLVEQTHSHSESPILVPVLSDLARLYGSLGDHLSAEPIWRQVLGINDSCFPDNQGLKRQDRINLAMCLKAQAELKDAESFLREVLASMGYSSESSTNVLPPPTPFANPVPNTGYSIDSSFGEAEVAAVLNILAGVVLADERPTEAELIYEDALSRTRSALGQQHPAVAHLMGELAGLYASLGRIDESITTLLRACEIVRRSLGEDHGEHLNLLRMLGGLYQASGNLQEAEKVYRARLTILRRLFGPDTSPLVPAMQLLADVLRQRGISAMPPDQSAAGEPALEEAEFICRKAVEILHQSQQAQQELRDEEEESDGDNNTEPAWEESENDFDEDEDEDEVEEESAFFDLHKEPTFPEAIQDQMLLELGTGLAKNNLASLLLFRRKFTEAEPLLRSCLETLSQCVGEDHPAYLGVLINLASLRLSFHQPDALIDLLNYLVDQAARQLPLWIALAPERFRVFTCQGCHQHYETALVFGLFSIANNPTAPNRGRIQQLMFDLVLAWKRIGIDVLAESHVNSLIQKYPEHAVSLQRYWKLNRQIANKRLVGPGYERLVGHRRLVSIWLEERNLLEERLSRDIPELQLRRRLRMIDTAAIRNQIPHEWVLIEFVYLRKTATVPGFLDSTETSLEPDEGRYLAFVVAQDIGPEVFDLGPASRINSLVRSWREAVENTSDLQTIGSELRHILLDPLFPLLNDRKGILLAPDGELLHIPLDALPLEGGIVLDRFAVRQITTARDMVRSLVMDQPELALKSPFSPPILLGKTSTTNESPKNPWWMDIWNWCSGAGTTQNKPLDEVSEIEKVLQISGDSLTAPNLDKALDRLKPSTWSSPPKLVHSSFPTFVEHSDVNTGEKMPIQKWQNPLLHCGLIFEEDRHITTKAITGWNLWQTALVTLSRGVTPVKVPGAWTKTSGLLSSFLYSGCRVILLTLWEGDEHIRREMVRNFYQRIQEGKSTRDAFVEARNCIRNRYPELKNWAGWVMVGG